MDFGGALFGNTAGELLGEAIGPIASFLAGTGIGRRLLGRSAGDAGTAGTRGSSNYYGPSAADFAEAEARVTRWRERAESEGWAAARMQQMRFPGDEWSRPYNGHVQVGDTHIWYGELDELGRATGVYARIEGKLSPGTGADQNWTGNGEFDSRSGHNRGHLYGKQLGGVGDGQFSERNLVILYRSTNESMIPFENQIRRWAAAGDTVEYAVYPIFLPGNASFIPNVVVMETRSTFSGGFFKWIDNTR